MTGDELTAANEIERQSSLARSYQSALEEARGEIERLQADSERLDWLLSHCDLTPEDAKGQPWQRQLVSREEIDTAREAAEAAKDG